MDDGTHVNALGIIKGVKGWRRGGGGTITCISLESAQILSTLRIMLPDTNVRVTNATKLLIKYFVERRFLQFIMITTFFSLGGGE